ncbi:MAG: polysaccharide deacetylase family protein [Chloroflexi bacterium]|jgi:peptidoglycan/xylan/chitin deacetylase (PgdA/CDA1 family)|nr:MAG: polysaccharide deacetylase family protein [Chloroflexota bacterium]
MRKRVGVLVALLFYYSGLIALSRWLMQRSGKRLIILNYHRASGGDLQRHLLYLRRHYRMMHLQEALEELYQPRAERRDNKDRRTLLVLTFDDGYHDNYTHAFVLARKLEVPITIFLIPGYVESGDYFWWGEGERMVQRATEGVVTIDGQVYDLHHQQERSALSQLIDTRLRHAHSVAERETRLKEFRRMLGVPTEVLPEEESNRPLTWHEIAEMSKSGYVSFGAHTMHHPILAYLDDPAEIRSEVEECGHALERRLDHQVCTFAYPVGRAEHIGDVAIQAVKDAGYTWAVTTSHAVNTPESDPLLLGRVLGDVSRHWLVMAAETSGIWYVFAPIWKLILGKGESA